MGVWVERDTTQQSHIVVPLDKIRFDQHPNLGATNELAVIY
jgi:hypothetical protein